MPGGINLKPTFIPQLTQHAGHGHPCGAEGAGDLLMDQAKLEPQPGLTGFAKALGEQFQEAPDPFFNAAQPQQGQERLRLAVAGGHGVSEAKRQLRRMLQLRQIEAEQIAIGERYSLVGLHIGECRTKGFIGTHKAKH